MPMQIRKKIRVEIEGSVFYFKPLTMKEAMARKELADSIDSGGNISEMADSVADLLIGCENVKDEEGNDVPFETETYKEVFTNSFTVFQVVDVIKAYLKEIGWTAEEGSLPNE